jgi:hypothetical protein
LIPKTPKAARIPIIHSCFTLIPYPFSEPLLSVSSKPFFFCYPERREGSQVFKM